MYKKNSTSSSQTNMGHNGYMWPYGHGYNHWNGYNGWYGNNGWHNNNQQQQSQNTRTITTHTCGAIILSSKKLLIPANCVHDRGAITLAVATVNSDEPYFEIDVSEEEIIIHPLFSKGSSPYLNDIAVIQLKRTLKFGAKIGKIDLIEKNYKARAGEFITILGYSESNNPYRKYSDTQLRNFNSTVTDFEVCRNIYSGSTNLENEKQFCVMLNQHTNLTYPGGILLLLFENKLYVDISAIFVGLIITRSKKVLGFISYSTDGMPHVCTSVIGHRKFIENPKVRIEIIFTFLLKFIRHCVIEWVDLKL